MSDLDALIAMLARAGIVWRYESGSVPESAGVSTLIVIEAKEGPQNLGYTGFVTTIGFDKDGSLVEWGCWE